MTRATRRQQATRAAYLAWQRTARVKRSLSYPLVPPVVEVSE